MFENTKDLNPLNTESEGYNISTLQVNIFKEMKDENIFLFQNVSSINSKTRYNRFVESFNSLTEMYKIKKDY
jgi:vacuolar-type H+-ATPase subunit I/STV1